MRANFLRVAKIEIHPIAYFERMMGNQPIIIGFRDFDIPWGITISANSKTLRISSKKSEQ